MTAATPSLPHYLRPGLRLVFIGYNPAIYSAEAGHYYARGGNAFWRQLGESELVGRAPGEGLGPEDDALLMDEAGIGFTDLCPRPTVRAEHLTRDEIIQGAHRLHAELLEHQPRVAVFSGRGIYQQFARHALGLSAKELATRPYGEQPERIAPIQNPKSQIQNPTVPWVIPSSSGLASKWHGRRLELLRELAGELDAQPEPRATKRRV
ncbi:MAG: mismatch-specific DNA-glycosylase [Anaerolinea sp.]|nr:mismatch-specific DNA-glycosylase [Anaerolinea sp.]